MSDNNDGGFVIEGESNIRLAGLLQIAHMLALEVNTGMTHSQGSMMKRANALSGSSKRTKKGALKDYVAWLQKQPALDGYEPSGSIKRAMGGSK